MSTALSPTGHKALVVTGGLFSFADRSPAELVRKQAAVIRGSSGAWMDVHLKVLAVRRVLTMRSFRRTRAYANAPYRPVVDRMLAPRPELDFPELTEVVLITALRDAGMAFEVATFTELHADARLRQRLLRECDLVLASTTMIRDASELRPLLRLLDRPWNHIVLGGALVSIRHEDWPETPEVEVLAVGYGEVLVPALVHWASSGFRELQAPAGGRLVEGDGPRRLYSGQAAGLSLDDLPTPDWQLAEAVHGRAFPMIGYESVRGCPYRCAFCNYPFLFDDNRFRTKSAERIAADWKRHADHGVKAIVCLDSLFTMPKRRITELCERLLKDGTELDWICYGRTDDLADLELCHLMARAGCRVVQIGLESGSQQQLDHMNKRTTVENNEAALRNCRTAGITSLVTVIVGFPGETEDSYQETVAFMRRTQPDFTFVTPFSVKYEALPILSPENRERYGIEMQQSSSSSFPYWRHATMSGVEAADRAHALAETLMREGVTLDASMFYQQNLAFRGEDRQALVDFQVDALGRTTLLGRAMDRVGRWTGQRMQREAQRVLG